MLKKCTWQGNLVNCSDIFTPVITDSGVCCAFNHRSNLKDSMYSQLVKEMQGPRDVDDMEVSTVASGIGRGLQVILDQNMDRWECFELEGLLTCFQGERGVCLHTLLWIPTFPWPALRVPTSPVRPSSPGPWTGSLCQGFSYLCLHRHQGCLSRCVFTSETADSDP